MVTSDTLETEATLTDAVEDLGTLWEKVKREAPPSDPFDDLGPGEVQFAGTFREVSWVTRTAQLYVDGDDGSVTTVRFTEAQDGWMRLVANVPVYVKGAVVDAGTDASGIGATLAGRDGMAAGESCVVDLTEVKVTEQSWEPYDMFDLDDVRQHHVFDPETHPTLSFDDDVDEFMREVRGPDYIGSGL